MEHLQYATLIRVFSSFQTASVFSVGVSASTWNDSEWYKWGSGVDSTVGAVNSTSSMDPGWIHYIASSSIAISCSVLQGNSDIGTGSVRVEARYWTANPLSS